MSENQRRCENAIETLRPLTARMNAVLAQLPDSLPAPAHADELDAATRGSMLVAGKPKQPLTPGDRQQAEGSRKNTKRDVSKTKQKSISSQMATPDVTITNPAWQNLEKMIDELSCSSIGEEESYISSSLPEVHFANGAGGKKTPKLLNSPDSTLRAIQEMSSLPETLAQNTLVTDEIPELSSNQLAANTKKTGKRPRSEQPQEAASSSETKRQQLVKTSPREIQVDPQPQSSHEGIAAPSASPPNPPKMKSPQTLWNSFLKLKALAQDSLKTQRKDLYSHVAMGAVREGVQYAKAKEQEYRQNPTAKSRGEVYRVLHYMCENFLKRTERAFRETFLDEAMAEECAEVRERLQLRNLLLNRVHVEQRPSLRTLQNDLKAIAELEGITGNASFQGTITKTAEILVDVDKAIESACRLAKSEPGQQAVPTGGECTIA